MINPRTTGILTMAFGSERYIKMAKTLALSLRLTNPDIPRAIVTDSKYFPEFEQLYDQLIPINPELGSGLSQKLHLFHYSPYNNTLFIDSDCIVIRNIQHVFALFSNTSFSNTGEIIQSGEWSMDVTSTLKKMGLNSLSKWNGGTYFFKKDELAKSIFEDAIKIRDNYHELGIEAFARGGINEEPVLSLAAALHGVFAVNDENKTAMFTPLNMEGKFHIDSLSGECRFKKNGKWVSPSIVHFCGSIADHFHYKRESFKIRLVFRHIPKWTIRGIEIFIWNLPYGLWVFLKRTVKILIGRKGIQYIPLLPLYSNQ